MRVCAMAVRSIYRTDGGEEGTRRRQGGRHATAWRESSELNAPVLLQQATRTVVNWRQLTTKRYHPTPQSFDRLRCPVSCPCPIHALDFFIFILMLSHA